MELQYQLKNLWTFFIVRILLKIGLAILIALAVFEIRDIRTASSQAMLLDSAINDLQKKTNAAVIARQLEASSMESVQSSESARKLAFESHQSLLNLIISDEDKTRADDLLIAIKSRFSVQNDVYANAIAGQNNSMSFSDAERLKSTLAQNILSEKLSDFKISISRKISDKYTDLLRWQTAVIIASILLIIIAISISIIDFNRTRCELKKAEHTVRRLRAGIVSTSATSESMLIPTKEIEDLIEYIESGRQAAGGER